MQDVKRFLAESPVAARVSLPTTVILNRLTLNPADVGRMIEQGDPVPGGGRTCDLEIGGQCVARGRIVHRRGELWFKVTQMSPLGTDEMPPAAPEIVLAEPPRIPEGGIE